jgi:hypothetical protein
MILEPSLYTNYYETYGYKNPKTNNQIDIF